MALVVNQNYLRVSDGSKWKILGTFACDTSYPVSGYQITPSMFGLSRIDDIIIQGEVGYEFDYIKGSIERIQAFQVGSIAYSLTGVPIVSGVLTERLYYTPIAGPVFAPGDVITGSVSGATGTVNTVTAREPGNCLDYTPIAGNFVLADVLTGVPSGASGNMAAVPITVLAIPGAAFSIAAVYDFAANTPLQITALRATLGAGYVRLQADFPNFYEAEVLQSSGITQLAWCYAAYNGSSVVPAPLVQVPAGTDMSGLTTVEFEAIGA